MRKEYGGYLPFEGMEGPDYFGSFPQERVLRTNSAKAAIHFALSLMPVRILYIPHYICASVREMMAAYDLEIRPYAINEQLLPEVDSIEADAGILIVNYFGVMEEAAAGAAARFDHVILDQSHAFYAAPIWRKGLFNIYSCRKFFGVPDGGYLIGADVRKPEPEPEWDTVSGHFSYLTESLENGTNAAYKEKQESDRYFYGNYKGMSRLSRRMLAATDYERVKGIRCENFRLLHSLLDGRNKYSDVISCDAPPAYLYPFYGSSTLKQRLVAEKIYVPTLWRELITESFRDTREYRLSENTVFLPVDQRYGAEDMRYLAERVKALSEETE